MTKLASFLASVLVLWPLLAQGATYTVPSGTQTNSNCSNIGTIAYAVSTCARTQGDTVLIQGGTYDEVLHDFENIPSFASGTSSQPITIAGAPGATVILRPTGTFTFKTIIYNHTGSWLVFDNLTIDGSGLTVEKGMQGFKHEPPASNITLKNSVIHHLTPTCELSAIAFEDCGGGMGIQGNAPGLKVQNVEIHHVGYGIYSMPPNGLFENLYIHDIFGYGIHMYPAGAGADATNSIIRNSRFSHGGQDPFPDAGTGCGIVIGAGTNIQVYNNIFDHHEYGCGIQVRSDSINGKLYNNTIVENVGECIRIGAGTPNTDVRNNLCYGNGQDIINEGSGTNLASNNANSRNPQFVDSANANYRLRTSSPRSPALDDAQNLSGTFTGDITGTVTRPASGNWDQGAYEMEAGGGGGPTSPPSKGTFFLAPGGTTTTDCDAAKGAVGSPSASPFGTYATARVCMLAGSTLYFRAGTYPPLDTNVTPFSGGSPSDGPTTLAAYPGETVTLQATGGSPVVFLHNSTTDHFLILQGLILDGNNINGTNGIAIYPGVNDIRLDGMEIKNTYYEGVFVQLASNIELRNTTRVHNSAFAGVGVVGLDRTTNTTITGSEVYASGGPGISSYGGNTNLIIEKSTIRNTPSGKGIILGNASTPDSGVRIANNLIYTNTHGIHLQNGTTGVGLYYNTLWNNSVACMLFDSGVTVSEAINNVCWQVATVTNNAGSGMALTTNQCTGPTGCTAGDPLFASVTPGDANFLHLCGAAGAPVAGCTGKSPAIDTGTPVPSLTSDYASKARPDGVQVDRGAFEEVPVPVPPAQVGLVPVYRTTHFLTLLP